MSRGMTFYLPYLFLRVKSLIGQGLGEAACKIRRTCFCGGVAQKQVQPAPGFFRRNGFALGGGLARACAETGTVSFFKGSQKLVRLCLSLHAPYSWRSVPVSAERGAETGTPVAMQAA
ncbi:hypothetical protein LMG19087_02210 [Ralstonia wenshanensis]|nr:hypothetical protein LMG19087_02210 [Ralstonia wenshanensis]